MARSFVAPAVPQLMGLPDKYRWEFTRRHPYYVLYWKFARPDYEPRDASDAALAESARVVLGAFGILDPWPPGTAYEEIPGGREFGRGWAAGAVSRPTLKGLVSALALLLPADVLADVGRYLAEIAGRPDDSPELRKRLLRPLLEADVPALDAQPPLMLTVNPHAPQTAIVAAVEEFVRGWKAELDLAEKRTRVDLLDETLAVWDRKEGWTGGGYDVTAETTLAEVGGELGLDLPTVRYRYAAAFGRLFCRGYDPAVWGQAFAALKLLPLVGGGGVPRLTGRRPWARKDLGKKAARKAVAPDRGRGDRRRPGIRELAVTEIAGLAHDVNLLLGKGKTDDEILAELELGEAFRSTVEYHRWRRDDLSARGGA